MTAALPSISVVIVTRDRPALLRDALRGIAAQRLAPLEVRIADDGELPLPGENRCDLRPLTARDAREIDGMEVDEVELSSG